MKWSGRAGGPHSINDINCGKAVINNMWPHAYRSGRNGMEVGVGLCGVKPDWDEELQLNQMCVKVVSV